MVSKVAMADGLVPMDVDRIAFDAADGHRKNYEYEQEIDVVNMSIQCHGCGGWRHYNSKCPTAWSMVQDQSQTGNMEYKGFGKGWKKFWIRGRRSRKGRKRRKRQGRVQRSMPQVWRNRTSQARLYQGWRHR